MTAEEIKNTYHMADIVERYGIRINRNGFCKCPFHDERTASMKIYKDSYYCYGCHRSGDIFSFVQEMDGLSFKEAFISLGGTYEKPTTSSTVSAYHAQKARESRLKEQADLEQKKRDNNALITFYRRCLSISEPLSDSWCDAMKGLNKQLNLHSKLNDLPY